MSYGVSKIQARSTYSTHRIKWPLFKYEEIELKHLVPFKSQFDKSKNSCKEFPNWCTKSNFVTRMQVVVSINRKIKLSETKFLGIKNLWWTKMISKMPEPLQELIFDFLTKTQLQRYDQKMEKMFYTH